VHVQVDQQAHGGVGGHEPGRAARVCADELELPQRCVGKLRLHGKGRKLRVRLQPFGTHEDLEDIHAAYLAYLFPASLHASSALLEGRKFERKGNDGSLLGQALVRESHFSSHRDVELLPQHD